MLNDSDSFENTIKTQSIKKRLFILLKDSVVYGTQLALSKFAILLILPITTRYLSTGGYGVLDTIMLAGTLLTIVMIAGQDETIGRFYYDKTDAEERKTLLTSALVIIISVCAVCAAAAYLLSHAVLTALFGSTEYIWEFRLILIYAPITTLINFYRSVMRWTFRKKAFFILSAGPTTLILILTYIFLVIFKWGVAGAIYAQIIANGLFIIAAVFLSKESFAYKIDRNMLTPILKYGLPVMATISCAAFIPLIDKGMYTHFFGGDTLGIYSFASRYALSISLPLTAFIISWGPVLFTTYNEDNANQTIQNVILIYAALFSTALYIQTAFAEPLTTLIASENYISSVYYVAPIALSLILETFSSITAAGMDISKKTYFHTVSIIAGIALMLITVYPLVKLMGPIGIAYCTLAGRLFSHILRTAASYVVHPFRYRLARSYITILLAFGLSLLCQRLPVHSTALIITIRAAFLFVLLGFIWTVLLPGEAKKLLLRKASRLFNKTNGFMY